MLKHWASKLYLAYFSGPLLDSRFSILSIAHLSNMHEKVFFVVLSVLCSIAHGKFDNITSTRTSYVTVTATKSSGRHRIRKFCKSMAKYHH